MYYDDMKLILELREPTDNIHNCFVHSGLIELEPSSLILRSPIITACVIPQIDQSSPL